MITPVTPLQIPGLSGCQMANVWSSLLCRTCSSPGPAGHFPWTEGPRLNLSCDGPCNDADAMDLFVMDEATMMSRPPRAYLLPDGQPCGDARCNCRHVLMADLAMTSHHDPCCMAEPQSVAIDGMLLHCLPTGMHAQLMQSNSLLVTLNCCIAQSLGVHLADLTSSHGFQLPATSMS